MGHALQPVLRQGGLPEAPYAALGAFLGRRVYAGVVVVLVSAMIHGLKPERVKVAAGSPGH